MSRSKRLYLDQSKGIFLMKLEDNWIVFIDGEESESVNHLDIPTISKAFHISEEVLEDFFRN